MVTPRKRERKLDDSGERAGVWIREKRIQEGRGLRQRNLPKDGSLKTWESLCLA